MANLVPNLAKSVVQNREVNLSILSETMTAGMP